MNDVAFTYSSHGCARVLCLRSVPASAEGEWKVLQVKLLMREHANEGSEMEWKMELRRSMASTIHHLHKANAVTASESIGSIAR